MDPFLAAIEACNSAVLPGARQPWYVGRARLGWVVPEVAAVLLDAGHMRAGEGGLVLDDPARLPAIGRALADQGLCRWRNEAFDVREAVGGPVLAQLDRGCLVALGVMAQGVHMDGVVQRGDGTAVWIARRAASKALDPGKLDHLVAGGVPAGLSPFETLVKEAAEEAGLPAGLACAARPVGRFGYAMERPEGLRRDVCHCYELALPADFVPRPTDGEVESFELWPLGELARALHDGPDRFKFNVSPVLIRLLLRHGAIAGSPEVRAALAVAETRTP